MMKFESTIKHDKYKAEASVDNLYVVIVFTLHSPVPHSFFLGFFAVFIGSLYCSRQLCYLKIPAELVKFCLLCSWKLDYVFRK